jgi:hypothetical protein
MTNYQQKLFSDLVNVNMLIDEQENKEVARFLTIAYHKIQEELSDDMGSNEYAMFIRQGREMFAPAQG